jgi:uncharacterized protein (DUF1501 family)
VRALTNEEVVHVSGGNWLTDALEDARVGAEVGAIIGYIVTETAAGAARGGLSGGAVMFSWSIGYSFGTYLYEMACG